VKPTKKKVKNIINKRLRHVKIQINKLWLINKIKIIVEGITSKIIVRYIKRLGILKRNVSQVKGLIREIGVAIKLNIGRDVKGRDIKERDMKGRDVKGRDVKGRDVKGRDIKGRDVKRMDVKERVNTERTVKKIIDKTVKTVQSILETSEKKIIKDLKAKIAEALASIKA
jgi:hypothetical protein